MRKTRSLYDILNVSPGAEPEVIEAAYRVLMKKYHPDHAVPGGAPPRDPAEINAAYAVLRDPAQRAEYDQREWMRQQAQTMVQAPAAAAPGRWRASTLAGLAVAIALGCGIGLALSGSIQIVPQQPRQQVAAREPKAARVDPALRSPEEETAEFLAAHSLPLPAPRLTMPEPRREPRADERVATVPVTAPRAEPRREPQANAPGAKPARRSAQDQDFLEREGFIY